MRKIPLALREQQTHNQKQVHVVCLTHTRINSEELQLNIKNTTLEKIP